MAFALRFIAMMKISTDLERIADLAVDIAQLAGKVILPDSEADKLRNLVQNELIEDYMVTPKWSNIT